MNTGEFSKMHEPTLVDSGASLPYGIGCILSADISDKDRHNIVH